MFSNLFSITTLFEGSKKYKVFTILGFIFKIRVAISKDLRAFIKNSKPKPLNDIAEPKRDKVFLSIVAIFKDEPDIIEWIEYHKLAGVERFYLYDNDSIRNYEEILKSYIDSGCVVYKKIYGKCQQRPAYRDAIYRYKEETEWMAIIDLDEYIVPVSTNDIKDFLFDYKDKCGVVINWLMFDSNGIDVRDKSKTIIELFTRVYKNYEVPVNRTVKTIVCPKKVRYVRSVHVCIYKDNELPLDENLKPLIGKAYFQTDKVSINKIRINHYHCKSRQDYIEKVNKGFADRTKLRNFSDEALNFKSTTHDYVIQKYTKELKKVLEKQ